MVERSPIHSEENLRFMEMRSNEQQYSYDLTQRLTFFVISIELIFCGYILLNFEKLGIIKFSSFLFLLSGCAAIFGIFWRFCYNQTFHDIAHGTQTKIFKLYKKVQIFSYWIYVTLTIIFFIGIVFVGFQHINKIENRKTLVENDNRKNIEILSQSINGIQESLNNISNSIENLAKLEPKVEVVVRSQGIDKNNSSPNISDNNKAIANQSTGSPEAVQIE